MRVLIITDSLGVPRNEIDVEKTWVELLMKRYSNCGIVFYTQCIPGLSSKDVPTWYASDVQPDLVITQFGVVDACRRTMNRKLNSVIQRLPVLSKCIRKFMKKYHYNITQKICIHYSSVDDYKSVFLRIINETDAHIYAIPIAPACSIMKQKVFNYENDVIAYNDVTKNLVDSKRIDVLNPYVSVNCDSIFLEDGHHLNEYGNELVFSIVSENLERFIIKNEV